MKKTTWLIPLASVCLLLSVTCSAQEVMLGNQECLDLIREKNYNSYSPDSLILLITKQLRTSDAEAMCLLPFYKDKFVGEGKELTSQYYYNALANHYLRKSQPDSVHHYIGLALLCDSILDNKVLKAIDIGVLGNLALVQGDLELAIEHYEKGISNLDPSEKPTNVSSIFNNLGVAYLKKGYLGTAMVYFNQALELAYIQANDYATESSLNLKANIGIIHRKQKHYQESLELLREVLQSAQVNGFYYSEYLSLTNIGAVYLEMERLDSARFWLKKGLEMAEAHRIDPESTLLNLAEAEYKSGNLEALKACISELDNYCRINGYEWIPQYYLLSAYAAEESGMDDECIRFLEDGCELSQEEGSSWIRIQLLEQLSRKYADSGRLGKSMELLRLVMNERDSLQEKTNNLLLADMTMKYQVDRYELKLEKTLAEAALLAQRNKLYKIQLAFAIGIILLLSLVFYLYHRRALAVRKALEMEVGYLLNKNTEMENQNEIHRRTILDKNQKLSIIKNSVEDIVEKYAPNARKLKRKLHISLNREIGQSPFKGNFEHLYPKFIKVLLEEYPDLTDRQLEYSMLIALGLKNKEIGEVLHVAEKSVEKMRSRLNQLFAMNNPYSLATWLRNKLIESERMDFDFRDK